MRPLLFIFLLYLSGCAAFADGVSEGRRGMDLYEAGDYEGATAAFQAGVLVSEDETGRTREALYMDLGLSQFAQSNFSEAAEAFYETVSLAEDPSRRAMASYNAGTALAQMEDLGQALVYLRRALILRPNFPEARFNYELVKRRLEGTQSQNGTPPEPSAFAEELKARADSLIANRRYGEAATLMNEGLRQDSTVAAYADFIQRLGEVVEIESMKSPAGADSAR